VTRLYVEDAELYDIAFDWDVAAEADWLVKRLGARCRSVLEPGCGSGRILLELAHRGLEVVGLDLSPQMVELARLRLGERGTVVVADMTDFDLGRRFDGAVSPINTLLHLTPAQLAQHLDCMARHLQADARYLVQVGLIEPDQWKPVAGSHWEASRGDVRLTVAWVDEELDAARGRSRQRSRIEILEGERAGEIIEEVHDMTAWTPATWADALQASPFGEVATYDGGKSGQWPRVEPTATGGLLWHELARS
jgi:cyclopropane fatty-acyl-phospholipid synthase-like methyltransferase